MYEKFLKNLENFFFWKILKIFGTLIDRRVPKIFKKFFKHFEKSDKFEIDL